MKKEYASNELVEKIIDYCKFKNTKRIYISGNGGSGKTEFSKLIAKEAKKYGNVNIISMDDFIVDTALRKSSVACWDDECLGIRKGRYTSSFKNSYFIQSIKAILYNLEKGNDYYHWTKKTKKESDCQLLYSNAFVTIIEGVGAVFLDINSENSISIFIECSKEIEISRRIKRAEHSNETTGEMIESLYNDDRNSQFKANISPYIKKFNLVLESKENYSFEITYNNIDVEKIN